MSQRVRTAWFLIVAMSGFAGLVFGDAGTPVKRIGPGAKIGKELAAGDQDPASPSGNNSPAPRVVAASPNAPLPLPLPGDTCANAIPLTLGVATKANSAGNYGVYCELNPARPCAGDADCSAVIQASGNLPNDGACVKTDAGHDDYQTPADTTCYAGIGQVPTTAPGRDLVFSFTAPADGSYTFEIIQQSPNDVIRTQNEVLYLTDCANAGTVNCLKGVNRPQSAAFISSVGSSNNQSEALDCVPMAKGQAAFVVFDDASPGKCSDNSHACFADSDCATGATCTPSLNAGGAMGIEVRVCNPEVEPNDTPAKATPYVCGMIGESHVAPAGHCYLGTRAGAVCTRSTFLEQTLPNSNMRCSISNNPCVVDLATGLGDCALPDELCQQQTDLDCDPRCDVGPNAGRTCTTNAFCNPVSDQGAVCAGTCQVESTCIVTATNVDTGVPCTPVCVGGLFPGRYCSGLTGCPGGGTCTTTVVGVNCATGQTCSRVYNEGDVDFYSLGSPAAGSLIFAGVDAKASSDYDFRMRITNDTQTLQFDDDDVTSRGGSNAPTIAGAVADGSPAYIKVSRTQPRTSSTYELYAHIQPPLAAAQLEDESGPTGNDNYFLWPGDILNCNPVTAGGYVKGEFAYNQDTDCFKFLVNKGDLMDWFGDPNPRRVAGAVALVDIPQPLVYDAEPAGISNFGFGANPRKNTNPGVAQPSLNALSPAVTSSYFQWRASYTGMLEVCYFAASQFLSQGVPNYPTEWAGSMTVNCGPVQNAGPGTTTADVSLTKVGPAGPVATGDFVNYTFTVTNNGSEIAQEVLLYDVLEPNLTFISLTVDDGFGGNNTACFSLPDAGDPTTNPTAPVYCINASMAPGTVTTYVMTAQVANCLGDGVPVTNVADIFTVSTDPNPTNDHAEATFLTMAAANNACTDIVCTGGTCLVDLCTNDDHCEGTVCKTTKLLGFVCSGDQITVCATDADCVGLGTCLPNQCDDQSLCTDDTCSSKTGCVNDSSQAGDLCDDFNACTQNRCDPLAFCVFPSEPATVTCDDGLNCTITDHCNGQGTCTGTSLCDDGNGCSDDFCVETTHECSYAPSVAGTSCSDGSACTTGEVCDGLGLATSCNGGAAVTCNDNNPCTTDTCDTTLGCVYTPIVCTASDQCHVAGTCDTGTGLCSNPAAPDGTTCNDGDTGTDPDTCQAGTCVGVSLCNVQPKPKSSGYYKKLCKGGVPKPSHSDALTDADAACVGQLTTTFAGITTATQICAVYEHAEQGHDTNGPNCKDCQKGEDELMGLALNICRQRICPAQEVDSACGSDHDSHNRVLTTVAASLATSDAIFSDPARTKASCKDGKCLAKEINNGKGIHHVSLMLSKEPGNKTRLTWASPVMDDGSGEASKYTIWRRVLNADAVYVKILDTTALTYVDNTTGTTNWEYEVTFTIQP